MEDIFSVSLLVQHLYGSNGIQTFLTDVTKGYEKTMFYAAYRVLNDVRGAEQAVKNSLIHIGRYPKIQDNILLCSSERIRRNYLILIADGRARLQRRSQRKEPIFIQYSEEYMSPSDTLEDYILLRERVAEVGRFFLQSDSVNALTLQLLWEGLSYQEICRELNISEANVRQRIKRGRTELVQFLRREDDE